MWAGRQSSRRRPKCSSSTPAGSSSSIGCPKKSVGLPSCAIRACAELCADVPIMIADESLQLDPLFSKGKLDTETDLPEDAPEAAPLPPFDATAMAQLEAMGFPAIRCQKALLATGNGDAEAAMNWLFQHMEDAGQFLREALWRVTDRTTDIDDPIVVAPTILASSAPSVSPEQVSMIVDMGFSSAQASKALRETVRSTTRIPLSFCDALCRVAPSSGPSSGSFLIPTTWATPMPRRQRPPHLARERC
jgi:hypothetical protein